MPKGGTIKNRKADCHPERPHFAKGRCQTCYAAWHYRDDAEYIKRRQREWNRKNSARHTASSLRWTSEHPERKMAAELRRLYGLSYEDYLQLLERQAGVCAICKRPPTKVTRLDRRLHVDHDHETGRVRGLLCRACNAALGPLAAYLEAALAYLAKP